MPIWTNYPTQTTPDDADTLLAHDVSETVVGNKMKRTTWANIKAAIKALADTYYLGIASKAADSDKLDGVDSTLFARQNAAPSGNQVLTSVAGTPTWVDKSGFSLSDHNHSGVYPQADGWIPATGAWTINTVATGIINVPDSSIFGVGNPVKLFNVSTKYFYVIAIPSGTTIQVLGDVAAGLAGAANTTLTACFYSKTPMPKGFLVWFNYTPTLSVSGGTVPTFTGVFNNRFSMNSKTVITQNNWRNASGGIAGAGGSPFEFTLPVPPLQNTYVYCGQGSFNGNISTGVEILVSPGDLAYFLGTISRLRITGDNFASAVRENTFTTQYEAA